ncbi:MAG TPA: alpha/beta fold hydrolase [Chitinophagales bacterium]|nr:alpha/beta fold hydrolase [Chitinophagales bacterium]
MENIVLSKKSNSVFTEESLFIPLNEKDVLHLKRFCGNQNGPVIFMLHGSVENGRIFYSKNRKGLAPFLARQGYDVFVADLRGRGLSTPSIDRNSKFGLTECIQEEIPAFLNEIKKIRGDAVQHWIAHSWGGILLLSYYARQAEHLNVSSMIFFGTKRRITVGGVRKFWMINVFYNHVFRLIVSLKGFVDVKRFGMGSENETEKSRRQTYDWVMHEDWKDEDGFDYSAALRNLKLPPMLFIAGRKDEVLGHRDDVQKLIKEIGSQSAEFYLAAKLNGNLHDYDHVTMLTHPDAPDDQFQYVNHWLTQHS